MNIRPAEKADMPAPVRAVCRGQALYGRARQRCTVARRLPAARCAGSGYARKAAVPVRGKRLALRGIRILHGAGARVRGPGRRMAARRALRRSGAPALFARAYEGRGHGGCAAFLRRAWPRRGAPPGRFLLTCRGPFGILSPEGVKLALT